MTKPSTEHVEAEKPELLHVERAPDTCETGRTEVPAFDIEREKRLLRKLDLRIVPILWLMFMLAFLDRTNIGNARIQGMTEDLEMTGNDFNIALQAFFVTYILFEVPSNIIIKRIRPSIYLASIMALWGIATIAQGFVKNLRSLIALRLLVGVFEAGLFPGCLYLIASWYKRYELQWRFNLFFSSSILAGGFSGLLAYGIANMAGVGGYNGWSWIFILEGAFTTLVALFAWMVIPDWPETAKFLTEAERAIVIARLAADVADAKMNRLDRPAIKRIFTDWKIYVNILMYMGVVNSSYALSFFTPTIINEMGYRAEAAQIRSIPVFVVAAIASVATAAWSDRIRHRFGFVIGGILIATAGYGIMLAYDDVPVGAKYAALLLVVAGGFIAQPVVIAWSQNNAAGHYKKSISSAMMIGFGNFGGIIASNIYITGERPQYPTGLGVSLGLLWMCAITSAGFLLGMKLENRRRDRGERDARLEGDDGDNLGDDHPDFRYTF